MLKISLFDNNDLDRIHKASLEVLSSIGIKINNQEAFSIFKDNGFSVDEQLKIVRFTPEQINQTIKIAKNESLMIYDRDGNKALDLSKGNVFFGPGGGAPNRLGTEGTREPSTKADVEIVTKICDSLENVDFVMTDLTAQDKPLKTQDLHELEAMVNNTTKPFVPVCLADGYFVEAAYKIHQVVRQEESMDHPFMILYFQPSSPLQLDEEPLSRLMRCMEYDFPTIISGALSAGGTAPVTIAGALVLGNAEVLGAMTLARLINKKPRLIYGIGGAALDMTTGNFCYGSPELGFLSGIAVAELAEYYGFRSWGRGACSDSKAIDAQFGFEVFMTAVLPALSGINLIHDAGRVDFGKSACFEGLVLSDEIIDCLKFIKNGVIMDSEHLAFDAIKEIGIAQSFLKSRHTLRHYKEQWKPEIFNRMDFSSWSKSKDNELHKRLKDKTEYIIQNHEPNPLPINVSKEISKIVGKYEKIINKEK